MEHKDLNDNKMSIETGISNGLIGKARKRGSLSGKNISKLINTYQDLSADWLFRGEGEMLKDVSTGGSKGNKDKGYIIELQKEKIERLEEKIRLFEMNA